MNTRLYGALLCQGFLGIFLSSCQHDRISPDLDSRDRGDGRIGINSDVVTNDPQTDGASGAGVITEVVKVSELPGANTNSAEITEVSFLSLKEGARISRSQAISVAVPQRSNLKGLSLYVNGALELKEVIAEPFLLPWRVLQLSDGVYRLEVEARYDNGELLRSKAISVTLDKTSPALTVERGSSVDNVFVGDFKSRVSVSDSEGLARFRAVLVSQGEETLVYERVLKGVTQDAWDLAFTFPERPAGEAILRFDCSDEAGNTSSYYAKGLTLGDRSLLSLQMESGDEGTTLPIIFKRRGGLDKPLDVSFTVGGAAIRGVDYEALPSSIYFQVGQAVVTLPVVTLKSPLVELNRNLQISIAPSDRYLLPDVDKTLVGTMSIWDLERSPRNFVIQAAARVVAKGVNLNFENRTGSPTTVYRKKVGTSGWGTALATLAASDRQFTDSSVIAGNAYEYRLVQRDRREPNDIITEGYLAVAYRASLPESEGRVILLVESGIESAIAEDLNAFESGLQAEGWMVRRDRIARTATVMQTKSLIQKLYAENKATTKALILVGRIPVPYSGTMAWDGHNDHRGAWASDTFYGDMDGLWTDRVVARNEFSKRNDNLPDDGKFDQDFLPSPLELAVGRIDFADMSGFEPLTEVDLMKRYLKKNQAFRRGDFIVPREALLVDHLSQMPLMGGFVVGGFANALALTGDSHLDTQTPWLNNGKSFLLGFSFAYSSYTDSNGIAWSVAPNDVSEGKLWNYSSNAPQVVFNQMFGSYFGDWDVKDSLLRAPLASPGSGLTNLWGNNPVRMLHTMAVGKPIGLALTESLNAYRTSNGSAALSSYLLDNDYRGGFPSTRSDLMGDPTLRLHIVPAPRSVTVRQLSRNERRLTWLPSTDPQVSGYRIYTRASASSAWTFMLQVPSSTTSQSVMTSTREFLVRALKNESGAFGDYLNLSSGSFGSL